MENDITHEYTPKNFSYDEFFDEDVYRAMSPEDLAEIDAHLEQVWAEYGYPRDVHPEPEENPPDDFVVDPELYTGHDACPYEKPQNQVCDYRGYSRAPLLWRGALHDETIVCVGTGPSAADWVDMLAEHGEMMWTIGVNRAFDPHIPGFAPNILLWQDSSLLASDKAIIDTLHSIRFAKKRSSGCSSDYAFQFCVYPKFDMPSNFGVLCGAGTTGHLAAQMAYLLGAKRVVLIGYDAHTAPDGTTDCYGHNQYYGYIDRAMSRHQKGLEWIMRALPRRGVEVINLSDNNFPPSFEYIENPEKLVQEIRLDKQSMWDHPYAMLRSMLSIDCKENYVAMLREAGL